LVLAFSSFSLQRKTRFERAAFFASKKVVAVKIPCPHFLSYNYNNSYEVSNQNYFYTTKTATTFLPQVVAVFGSGSV
jgi:hypothetical protein